MTELALRRLEKKDRGFVMQIEGGRVDHGAHSNDLPAMLFDLLAFDDAIETVLRWMDGRDDTLLVITTDHGNANPALTVYGKPGAEMFARIPRFTHTLDWAISKVDADFKGAPPAERVKALLGFTETAIGGELRPEDRDWVMRAAQGQRVNGFDLNNSVRWRWARSWRTCSAWRSSRPTTRRTLSRSRRSGPGASTSSR